MFALKKKRRNETRAGFPSPSQKKIHAAIKRNILSRKNDNLQVPMSIQRFIPPLLRTKASFSYNAALGLNALNGRATLVVTSLHFGQAGKNCVKKNVACTGCEKIHFSKITSIMRGKTTSKGISWDELVRTIFCYMYALKEPFW